LLAEKISETSIAFRLSVIGTAAWNRTEI